MLRRTAIQLLGLSIAFGTLGGHTQPVSSARQALSAKLPVSIYYSLPASSGKVIEGFVQEFQETHPYLDIQVKNFPRTEELYRQLNTPGGDHPTLAIVDNSWLNDLVKNQPDLYPVETWMPKEQFGFSWAIKNNAYVPLWDASHVGGTLYALPYFFTTKALIYNSDVLQQAGVKQVPVTWEQVLAAAKKISTGLALSLGSPDHPDDIARNFQLLVWQSGGEGLGSSTAAATTPAVQTVVDYLKKVAPSLAPLEGSGSPPAGMYIGNVDDYFKLKALGLPVKSALIPGFDKSQRITETQGWALAMFKSVPEREMYKVQELAFFLLDFPQQRRFAEQTPYLAAHLKVFDNPFYRRERLADHANLRVFLNSVGKSKIVDTSGQNPQRYNWVGRMLGAVLRGEKTPMDLLTTQ